MKPPSKAWISALSSALLAQSAFSIEDWAFAQTIAYKDGPIYNQIYDYGRHGNHLMLDTNALLFRRNTNGTVVNELAKSVEYTNNGTTMRIAIKDNCAWSDGIKITADEIANGITRVYLPEHNVYVPGRKFILNGSQVFEGVMDPSELGIRVISSNAIEIDTTVGGDLVQQILAKVNA